MSSAILVYPPQNHSCNLPWLADFAVEKEWIWIRKWKWVFVRLKNQISINLNVRIREQIQIWKLGPLCNSHADRIKNGIEGRIYSKHMEQSPKQYCDCDCTPMDYSWPLFLKMHGVFLSTGGALSTAHSSIAGSFVSQTCLHFGKASNPASPVTMNSWVLLRIKMLTVCF